MANEKLINLDRLTEYDKMIKEHIKNEISTLYDYKGSVDNFSDLPINPEKGDVWNVVNDNGTNYAWDGERWDSLGSSVDLSGYVEKKDHVSLIKQEAAHSFKQGAAISAGTHCYYWDAIDFTNMQIHIVDGWQPGLNGQAFPVISQDFESDNIFAGTGPSFENQDITGYEFSITNGDHFYRFGRVTNWDGIEVLEFEFINGSEFDSIVTYDNPENIHGLSYSLVFNDHPELGDHLVGNSSRAYGEQTKTYASNSTAMGKFTEAYGNGSIATGKETKAIGNYSASFGFDTQAHGHHSISSGKVTRAFGNSSFATGSNTVAKGNYSFVSGYGTEAGETAVASGYNSKAFAPYSTAEGFQTTVEEDTESSINSRGAHVEGALTIARGYGAHAQNIETQAIAQGASASGRGSVASGKYSSANGDKTTAAGVASFTVGESTTANGKLSFVGGKGSVSNGIEGFAFGHNANAGGDYSFAMGYNANANKFGVAIGRNCKVQEEYQIAVGVNNTFDSDMLFMVGNGANWGQTSDGGSTAIGSRSNALTVYKNGETKTGILKLSQDSTEDNAIGKNDITTVTKLRNAVNSYDNNLRIYKTAVNETSNIECTSYMEITPETVYMSAQYYDGSPDATLSLNGECVMTSSWGGKLVVGSELSSNTSIRIDRNNSLKIGSAVLTEDVLSKLIKILENNPVLATDTAITKDSDGTIVLA